MGEEPEPIGQLLDNILSRIKRRPDFNGSVLWDAENWQLSDPALVGFVDSEVKARVPS